MTLLSGEPLEYLDEIPINLQTAAIVSEKSYTASYANGELLFQCISDCRDYALWYKVLISRKTDLLISKYPEPRLILRVSLNGILEFELPEINTFKLGPGQFLLYYQDSPYSQLLLQADSEYRYLEIAMPVSYLDLFMSYYPILQGFVENARSSASVSLTATPLSGNAALLDNIEKLLQCIYKGSLRGMFTDARIMDIMTEVFTIAQGSTRTEILLSQDERERIWSVRDMLGENLDIHYTIKDLSRMVYINEYKLKKGFQQLTGATIFDYQLGRRMQVAQKWLKETDLSLEEIATATGYQYLSSFVAAFKHRVGVTPAAFRKNAVS
ncbi:helix-turn-helix domain-containing protein [Chitinophaga sp. Hz27]|uniref:helix-turn-helix domain-containing protein n=1 Tax=Chitinophaga sp. Hz27 TaxID=3347169 RepID=UPI0035E21452